MALRVELKPDERFILGLVSSPMGPIATGCLIEGDAPLLREKALIINGEASQIAPAKRIIISPFS